MSDKDMSNFAQLYDVSNAELTKIVENILHKNAANVISQLASAIVNKNVPIVTKATNDDLASS
jgi:predicted nucleotidyltransferase